ncbi:glycine--tRNA ligase [Candidatus Woesearchaeota archaeon]|nr:glycine--tRNA ligase [Candidatus Woesearchaeota archaeon]
MTLTTDSLAIFCKKKGFVYPSSSIYGGMAGFWDFGPLGVELMNNIKQSWWKHFVHSQEGVVGIEGSIISHPSVWKASGHVDNFNDPLLMCSKCKHKVRADHFIEDKLKQSTENLSSDDINALVQKHKLVCPQCKGVFEELRRFNMMFETLVGGSANAYLRPETAQAMFTNFKLITETTRQKLPFGIAQIGKCFRNEISPRDFLFRSREFTIAEFEFFLHPEEQKCSRLSDRQKNVKLRLLSAEVQEQGKHDLCETTIGKMIAEKKMSGWHGYWLAEQLLWYKSLGLTKLKVREHVKTELSHYSSATFDIDYEFPFGSKEISGNAHRGQYDLSQHMNVSGEKLDYFDEESKTRIVPQVIEPTFGMERAFLAVLVEGFHNDKERGKGEDYTVLKIHPQLAPFKVAVLPLLSNKEEIVGKARAVYDLLRTEFRSFFDTSGAIGRRYARMDEVGTPFCVTIDFESLQDDAVTVRDRDTTKQERVKIGVLKEHLSKKLSS